MIDIQEIVKKYAQTEGMTSNIGWDSYSTQFDDHSAEINYSMVREIKPKVVVEFGTKTGRCTNDILRALLKNGGKFQYRPYELDDQTREHAQKLIDDIFKEESVKIGGDITQATDIPNNIDYLFIDNSHDLLTTKWVFDVLIKKCRPGCVVQIHDWTLTGDWGNSSKGNLEETDYMKQLHIEGKLPLEKLYWTIDEGDPNKQSAWFIYKPIK